MIGFIISLVLAYIIGSIPTSLIFTRLLKGKDIREHGSGNAGATNVFRVAGKLPAILVLIIDILKGFIVVLFLPEIFFNNTIGVKIGFELYKILLGATVIGGHVFSVFMKFKGGKGVATSAGVLIAIAPKSVLGSFAVWVIIFGIFRIVSIASIAASLMLPVFSLIFYDSLYLVLFSAALCASGIYKHKSNIQRLIRGEEKKLF